MKNILAALFASLFVMSSAFAHIEIGTHMGTTPDGQPCSFEATEMFFEGGVKHPLNERVRVKVAGEEFVMVHPPVVDAKSSTAFFNHDLFQGVIAKPTGARALVIEMSHEAASEGPKAFHLIDHAWKSDIRSSLKCEGLKFSRK